jgi:hypothetical protein
MATMIAGGNHPDIIGPTQVVTNERGDREG